MEAYELFREMVGGDEPKSHRNNNAYGHLNVRQEQEEKELKGA